MRVALNLGNTKVFARHFWISDFPANGFLSDMQSAAGARAASASGPSCALDEAAMATVSDLGASAVPHQQTKTGRGVEQQTIDFAPGTGWGSVLENAISILLGSGRTGSCSGFCC